VPRKTLGGQLLFIKLVATLHDLIMRMPLFDGWDQPCAKLYDAVRFHSPEINTSDCEEWLIQLARCCLVKNWRERIQLVSWESFDGPPDIDVDLSFQRQKIKPRFSIRTFQGLKRGEKATGRLKVLERCQRPSIHCR
jgi:eukaryotic-like serine/threonine-protein kinase